MHVIDLLRELVHFPVLGGQSNLSIIQWIEGYLRDFGVASKLVYNGDRTKASLHCRIGPAIDGGVILSGHTDVVPAEGQEWLSEPFELTDKGDGRLYGRGACDMKGFLACCLAVIPDMMRNGLKKPIYLAFSYDEEIGCLAAPELAADIVDSYEEKPSFAIIGEPTSMQPVVAQKGIYILDITVNGSAGHSSRIRQEVSAVHEAARLVLWLEEKMDDLVRAGSLDHRFDPPNTSLHSGQIQGGIAPNVIADRAVLTCDIRVIPSDDIEMIVHEFNVHCRQREAEVRQKFPEFKIESTERHPPVPPLDTAKSSPVVPLIRTISQCDTLGAVSYAAEAGQFAECGFHSVICGPGSIAQAHRANEYIEKSQLEAGVAMLRRLVKICSE